MTPRDLDAEVAAKVLGCAVLRHEQAFGHVVYTCACDGVVHGDPNPEGGRYTRIRRYSEDWGAMREVVEAMVKREAFPSMDLRDAGWCARMEEDVSAHPELFVVGRTHIAPTLPEAVARAALAAVTQEART